MSNETDNQNGLADQRQEGASALGAVPGSVAVGHAMMLPCAAVGFIFQKIMKWTIGGFIVGWEVARRG